MALDDGRPDEETLGIKFAPDLQPERRQRDRIGQHHGREVGSARSWSSSAETPDLFRERVDLRQKRIKLGAPGEPSFLKSVEESVDAGEQGSVAARADPQLDQPEYLILEHAQPAEQDGRRAQAVTVGAAVSRAIFGGALKRRNVARIGSGALLGSVQAPGALLTDPSLTFPDRHLDGGGMGQQYRLSVGERMGVVEQVGSHACRREHGGGSQLSQPSAPEIVADDGVTLPAESQIVSQLPDADAPFLYFAVHARGSKFR